MMKNVFRVFALSAVIAFSSCSKDDKDSNDPNGNNSVTLASTIEGSWEITSLEQQNGETSVNGTQTSTFSGVGRDFVGLIQFKADGTTESNIGYTMDIQTVIQGLPPVDQSVDIPQTALTGSYQVISNTEVATSAIGAQSQTFTVSDLTANSMKWTVEVVQTQQQGGVTATSSFDLVMVLQKK